jgi:hypothetical protein
LDKVTEARKLVTPPLSQRELTKRLKDNGLKVTPAEVAEIEAGKRFLNCFQASVLASVLNTTVFKLNS